MAAEFEQELCRVLAARYGLPLESPGVTRRAASLAKLLRAADPRGPGWSGYFLIDWRDGAAHKVLPLCREEGDHAE